MLANGKTMIKVTIGTSMNIQAAAEQFRIDAKRVNGLLELGFSRAEIYQLVAPQRTLARRKNKLSLEESDKVQRLERIMAFATDVLGSEENARGWLREKNRALGGAIPLEVMASETGARSVEMQLHAIDHGIYA